MDTVALYLGWLIIIGVLVGLVIAVWARVLQETHKAAKNTYWFLVYRRVLYRLMLKKRRRELAATMKEGSDGA